METLIQTFFCFQKRLNIHTDSLLSTILSSQQSSLPSLTLGVSSTATTFQEKLPSSPFPTTQNSQTNPISKKPTNGLEDHLNSKWVRHFRELKNFKRITGHTNVTRTRKETRKLGNWVAEQRRKREQGRMARIQVELLSCLGFEWRKKRRGLSNKKKQ